MVVNGAGAASIACIELDQGDGPAARERHPVRHQGRDLAGPHRGHEPVEERPRRAHQGAHARGGDGRRRRLLRPVGQGRGDQGHGEVDGGQADHLRHGQSRSRDHAGGRARGARRRHHRHRPQRLRQPDQQRAGLPLHLPRRARRARPHHQRGDEGRRRRGAGQARARGRARRGRPRLFRPPAALRAGLYRAGAVRSAPDLGGVVGGGAGGDGFRRGAPADPRHGGVPARALGPPRSDQPLAAEPVRAGQGQPAAHRLRRGRGGAHHPRRRRVPRQRLRHADPDRPRGAGARDHEDRSASADTDGHRDPQCAAVDAQRALHRPGLQAPAARRLPAPRRAAHGQPGPQRVRRLHGGDGRRRRHGDRHHAPLPRVLRRREARDRRRSPARWRWAIRSSWRATARCSWPTPRSTRRPRPSSSPPSPSRWPGNARTMGHEPRVAFTVVLQLRQPRDRAHRPHPQGDPPARRREGRLRVRRRDAGRHGARLRAAEVDLSVHAASPARPTCW